MTIPIIRKRAKKPKTRTGCRTCRARHIKCDEAKPICLRCSKSGRDCAGYDFLAASSSSSSFSNDGVCALILPKVTKYPPELLQVPRSPSTVTVNLTNEERFGLDFFRRETLHQLPGNSWTLSWDRLVTQMCYREPAVTHAAIAVGALHRALTIEHSEQGSMNGLTAVRDLQRYHLALDQCNKAMSAVRERIKALGSNGTDGDVEVVLLVSLLFFCFEILHNEDKRASMHFRTGIRILYERIRHRKPAPIKDKRVVELKVQPRTNLDLLTQTFVRLDHDFVMSADEDYYLHPVIDSQMPRSFTSFDEAMVYLDVIHVEIVDFWHEYLARARQKLTDQDLATLPADCPSEWVRCLAAGKAKSDDLSDRPDLIARIEHCQRLLRQWMSALAFIPLDPDRETMHLLLQIEFFHIWIAVETALDQDVIAVDRFEDQFSHMMNTLERYVTLQGVDLDTPNVRTFSTTLFPSPDSSRSSSTSPTNSVSTPSTSAVESPAALFTPIAVESSTTVKPRARTTTPVFCLGTGIVPCLGTVAFNSRSSALRKRCLRLIRAIDMSGIFDSAWLAAFIECLVCVEERTARILLGRDPDTDTRDLQAYEVPAQARVLELDVDEWQLKKETTPEFYKQDSGKMVYAYMNDQGEVRVTSTAFQVFRSSGPRSFRAPDSMSNGDHFDFGLLMDEMQTISDAGYGSDG